MAEAKDVQCSTVWRRKRDGAMVKVIEAPVDTEPKSLIRTRRESHPLDRLYPSVLVYVRQFLKTHESARAADAVDPSVDIRESGPRA